MRSPRWTGTPVNACEPRRRHTYFSMLRFQFRARLHAASRANDVQYRIGESTVGELSVATYRNNSRYCCTALIPKLPKFNRG